MTDIYYHDFIKSKKIETHNFNCNLYAVKDYLTSHPELDGVIDNTKEVLSLLNVAALRIDSNGNYYYQYTFKRYCDIMQNIRVIVASNKPVKVTYFIGGYEYQPHEVDAFVSIAATYNDCDIRITFLEKPEMDDIIEIHSDKYLLRDDHRRTLYNDYGYGKNKKIITNTHVYEGGICSRLKQ